MIDYLGFETGPGFTQGLDKLSVLSDKLFCQHVKRAAESFASRLDVPTHFLEMLFLVEDKRFGSHIGVDVISTIRAVTSNLIRSGYLQGASTITQQLYDIRLSHANATYIRKRTMRRKIHQVAWAVGRELESDKCDILREYLSTVYWGKSYIGLDSAARGYFGRRRHQLTVAESFFLTERLASPNLNLGRRRHALLSRPAIQALMSQDESSDYELLQLYDQNSLNEAPC